MQIIKDQQIINDALTYIADDEALPAQGDISVSLQRWKEDQDSLLSRPSKVGVRLTASDEVSELAQSLNKLKIVELDFAVYTDGRAFSQARLLRQRYHYQGEIRAVGNFMVDQVHYLWRVGVNAFQLNKAEQLPLALELLKDFSVTYQASTN